MAGRKPFSQLTEPLEADPEYRALLEQERRAIRTAFKLIDLRRSRGLTQQQMASRLGVSQGRVSEIEHGDDLQFSTIQRYVEALGGHIDIKAVFPDGEPVDLVAIPSEEPEAAPAG